MMEAEVTAKTKKTAREYGLTPEEMAFVDLVSLGWTDEDAYAVAIRTGAQTWTKKALRSEYERILKKDGARRREQDNKKILSEEQKEQIKTAMSNDDKELLARATSKEKKLIELQATLETKDPGSSDWLKINQQIIDVSRMKQDEVKTEDTTIHYYLPVNYPRSCEECVFYKGKK